MDKQATEIVPGHDRPFRLEADGSISYLNKAAAVRLTIYPGPGQDPTTVPLS